MKTSRIKSIIIVILALVNVFLLVLLLSRQGQQRAAYERSVSQLSQLLTSSNIEFDTALLPASASLPSADLTRDSSAEASLAHTLLGESAQLQDIGGGISLYESDLGSLQFRENGTVDAALDCYVSDPRLFCENVFQSYGYVMDDTSYAQNFSISSGSGTICALRKAEDHFIFSAPLVFSFEKYTLVSVSGSFLPSVTIGRSADGVDAITALVRFLDYRNVNGLVCTQIRLLESGYLPQSSATGTKLVPVWHISTDVSDYYVNFITGQVTRE